MSYSNLYVIDKKFYGENFANFGNSWLFSPIVWDVLSEKYLPKKYGMTQSVIGVNGSKVWNEINDIMNGSDNACERICWEITNQCVYFSKDKKCVSENIMEFVNTHKEFQKGEDGIGVLEREPIIERFAEISNSIMSIDENEYPYFVFKNTSCDDGVERWFAKYDSEIDEYVPSSLKDFPEFVTEFVVIENGNIREFIGNDKFPYENTVDSQGIYMCE